LISLYHAKHHRSVDDEDLAEAAQHWCVFAEKFCNARFVQKETCITAKNPMIDKTNNTAKWTVFVAMNLSSAKDVASN
jgi:hypothetical protein